MLYGAHKMCCAFIGMDSADHFGVGAITAIIKCVTDHK